METFEKDPDFLATLAPPSDQAPFGYSFDEGVLNANPAEEFPAQANQDVDGLLFLGYLTDAFDVYGHKFVIRTLRRGEKLAVGKIVQEYTETVGLGDAISAATIAASILLVDSRPLSLPLSDEESSTPDLWIRRNFAIVSKWYDPIIDSIYDKYLNLLQRQTRAFLEFQGK